MSRYAWERGTITLPSAEVATVKKAVRDATNALHERRYQRARDLWRKHGRKLTAVAKKAGDDWWAIENAAISVVQAERPQTRGFYGTYEMSDDSFDYVANTLQAAAKQGRAPRRDEVRPARATNKTTRFAVSSEAAISFEGREVTWSVPENNHAVETAREDPIGQAFFKALDRVKWTRGSGGEIVGNDEYNADSDYAGGGSNYVTAEYGPHIRPVRPLRPNPRVGRGTW